MKLLQSERKFYLKTQVTPTKGLRQFLRKFLESFSVTSWDVTSICIINPANCNFESLK